MKLLFRYAWFLVVGFVGVVGKNAGDQCSVQNVSTSILSATLRAPTNHFGFRTGGPHEQVTAPATFCVKACP